MYIYIYMYMYKYYKYIYIYIYYNIIYTYILHIYIYSNEENRKMLYVGASLFIYSTPPFKIHPTAMVRKGNRYLRLPDIFSFTAAFILFGTNALANNWKWKRRLHKEFQAKEILYRNIFKNVIVIVYSLKLISNISVN